jgi:hypothetical protein
MKVKYQGRNRQISYREPGDLILMHEMILSKKQKVVDMCPVLPCYKDQV